MSGISSQIQSRIIDPAKIYNDTHKYQSFETDMMTASKILGDYHKYEIGLVSPVNGKSVEMMKFDDNLYDIRSAQFAVETYYTQQLQRQYQHFQTNRSKYHVQLGLKFTLYTSPMIVDNIKSGGTASVHRIEHFSGVPWDYNYFSKLMNQKTSPVTTGYSDDFSGLSTALNSFDTTPLNKKFYVEWFGYFTPSETGLYGFSISTSNGGVYVMNAEPLEMAMIWVGDVALVNYNIDNSLTGNTLDKLMMTKDNIYPIRIQYGSGNMNTANQLTVDIMLNGQSLKDGANGTGRLISLMENTSYKTPYEPIQIHYALVNTSVAAENMANDETTLYHLYITKFDVLNNYRFNQQLRLAKTNSNYNYRQVGLLNIDNTDSVCTFAFQPNGELVLKNQNGRSVKLTALAANTMGDDVYLELRGGNIYVMKGTTELWNMMRDTQFSQSSQTIIQKNYSEAIENATWSGRYNIAFNQNIHASQMASNEMLDGTNALYSSDGKMVLYVREHGLYLVTSHYELGQRFHTTATEKNNKKFYLLSANGDTKLGSQMLVNQTTKELQFVSIDGNILKYLDEFVTYTGDYSFPPNVTNRAKNYIQRDRITPEECQKNCIQNPKCGHYYTYETGEGDTHCIMNTNNDAPLYLPNNPPMNVKPFSTNANTNSEPTLHKRKKTIRSQCKMDVYDVKYDSANTPITADMYRSYDNYSMNYNPYNPVPEQEGPCGDADIAKSIKLFKTGKETFVSGYNSTPCQSLNGPQCVQDIQQNIDAVNRAFQSKQADNVEVQHKYDELANLIHTKFEKQYNKIHGNPLYDAIDDDGNLANAEKSRHSLLNGMIEDVKDTMIRQNTYYIMANLFAAIFLVGLFSLVPDSS